MADTRPIPARDTGFVRRVARQLGACLMTLFAMAAMLTTLAAAQESPSFKSAGGLSIYLGIVPAEIVKGYAPERSEESKHGGPPRRQHNYHVMVAVFDSATGARVSGATVTAQVSGLGLSGVKRNLEPMDVGGALTYGNFFDLPGRDLYTIRVAIQREPAQQAVTVEFKYDHRSD